MKNVIERTAYLESLGFTNCTNILFARNGHTTEYWFESGDMSCSIYADEFEIGDSVSQIMRAAEYYSCCGDLLDKDSMMCPSCREHC